VTTTTPRTTENSGDSNWLAFLFGARRSGPAADVALLLARAGLAWVFFVYGAQKLFGWFNGAGIHQTSLFMADQAGLKPGGFFAVAAGVIEFGGAIALALGLFTRLAGLALFVDMVMAMITTTWKAGLAQTTTPPGYELNVALAGLALVVMLLGAGRFSLDYLIERRLLTSGQGSRL